MGLHGKVLWFRQIFQGNEVHTLHHDAVALRLCIGAYNEGVSAGVLCENIKGFGCGDADAFSLTDGVVYQAGVLPDFFAAHV